MSEQPPLALALSGGGFRATLYHLGVLEYLCRTGRLHRIAHIVGVSGGSLTAAHLLHRWPQVHRRSGDLRSGEARADRSREIGCSGTNPPTLAIHKRVENPADEIRGLEHTVLESSLRCRGVQGKAVERSPARPSSVDPDDESHRGRSDDLFATRRSERLSRSRETAGQRTGWTDADRGRGCCIVCRPDAIPTIRAHERARWSSRGHVPTSSERWWRHRQPRFDHAQIHPRCQRRRGGGQRCGPVIRSGAKNGIRVGPNGIPGFGPHDVPH